MTKPERPASGEHTRLERPAASPGLTVHVGGANDPSAAAATARAPAGEAAPGDAIGRFVVLGLLGGGGMGVVYSAYDPHLDRKVAIKLLRAGSITESDARARLLREAQAMAKVNHPNVVAVHEVGTFRDQVYVAMEFAEGGTLRAWLKTPRDHRDIVARFVAAGRGLAAAHAAGLIHRDFKPDNVLITGDGSVRVTDFGIVAIAGELVERVRERDPKERGDTADPPHVLTGSTPLSQQLTKTGAVMGTPFYMAPEQFRGAVPDARGDQFSFCVALYEALYGSRPFAGESFEAIQYNVLAGDLVPPPKDAKVPASIRRALLRGLAAVPAERYPAMTALLADLSRDPGRRTRRALVAGGAGLAACGAIAALVLSPGAAERCSAGADRADLLWSAARRGKLEAAFAASDRPHAGASLKRVAALLGGWDRSWRAGYVDACEDTHARDSQTAALLDLRLVCLQRRLADAGATVDLLGAGGPDAVDRAVKVVAELPGVDACADAAALTAAVPPPDDAKTRAAVAAVRTRIDEARGLGRVGRFADAVAIAREARAAATATGYRPVEGEALYTLGTRLYDAGDKAALETLREAMLVSAKAGDHAGLIEAASWVVFASVVGGKPAREVRDVAELADSLALGVRLSAEIRSRLDHAIGLMLERDGRPDEARTRYEQALAASEQALGPDHLSTLDSLTALGNLANGQGRFDEARALLARSLEARELTLGKDHPEVASDLNNLGMVDRAEGKLEAARALYERALAIRIAALGPGHPDVATSYNNLGTLYGDLHDLENAEASYEKARVIWENHYGPDHVDVTRALVNLATVYMGRDDPARARANLERVIRLYEHAYGKDHFNLAAPLANLATVAKMEGKLDEALQHVERAISLTVATHGEGHPDVADYLGLEATVLRGQGKLEAAEATYLRGLAATEKAYGPDHPHVGASLVNLGFFQYAREHYEAASGSHTRALAIFETALGRDHVHNSYPLIGLAQALLDQGRAEEAVPLAERALALRERHQMSASMIGQVRFVLAEVLVAPGKQRDRKRALALAKQALAEFESAGDTDNTAQMKLFLAEHW